MTDRERPDGSSAGSSPGATASTRADGSQGNRQGGSRQLDLVDVTNDPAAADLRTVVVAFRCTACQQMLHIEYLVGPSPGGAAPADGVACPQCARRHPIRLPGVVRDVRPAY